MTTAAQSLQFKELSKFKKGIFAKTRTDLREWREGYHKRGVVKHLYIRSSPGGHFKRNERISLCNMQRLLLGLRYRSRQNLHHPSSHWSLISAKERLLSTFSTRGINIRCFRKPFKSINWIFKTALFWYEFNARLLIVDINVTQNAVFNIIAPLPHRALFLIEHTLSSVGVPSATGSVWMSAIWITCMWNGIGNCNFKMHHKNKTEYYVRIATRW